MLLAGSDHNHHRTIAHYKRPQARGLPNINGEKNIYISNVRLEPTCRDNLKGTATDAPPLHEIFAVLVVILLLGHMQASNQLLHLHEVGDHLQRQMERYNDGSRKHPPSQLGPRIETIAAHAIHRLSNLSAILDRDTASHDGTEKHSNDQLWNEHKKICSHSSLTTANELLAFLHSSSCQNARVRCQSQQVVGGSIKCGDPIWRSANLVETGIGRGKLLSIQLHRCCSPL